MLLKRVLDALRSKNGLTLPFILNFGFHGFKLRRKFNGVSYWIRPFTLDWFIEREIFRLNTYGVSIRRGDHVLDCGAHIGLFSVWAACQGAYVRAFEPDLRNFDLLSWNTRLLENVSIFPYAVFNRNGFVLFHLSHNRGNNSIYAFSQYDRAVPVKCVDASMLLPVDVVKLDVEGSEYDILECMDLDLVKREIALEYHFHGDLKYRVAPAVDRIKGAGFKVDLREEFGLNGYLHARKD